MSTLRRARIKASAAHLASLAGKRRVNQEQNLSKKDEANEVPKEDVSQNNSINALEDTSVSNITEESQNETEQTNEIIIKQAPPRPLLKSRFRPNLSESDQQRGRLRRISGCEATPGTPGGRIRTISGSSDDANILSPR